MVSHAFIIKNKTENSLVVELQALKNVKGVNDGMAVDNCDFDDSPYMGL